jgi:hypothetical protein
MLSFSILCPDLIKLPYFTDLTQRGDRRWKEAQRQGENKMTLRKTLMFNIFANFPKKLNFLKPSPTRHLMWSSIGTLRAVATKSRFCTTQCSDNILYNFWGCHEVPLLLVKANHMEFSNFNLYCFSILSWQRLNLVNHKRGKIISNHKEL